MKTNYITCKTKLTSQLLNTAGSVRSTDHQELTIALFAIFVLLNLIIIVHGLVAALVKGTTSCFCFLSSNLLLSTR
jgi:hypothetical protein